MRGSLKFTRVHKINLLKIFVVMSYALYCTSTNTFRNQPIIFYNTITKKLTTLTILSFCAPYDGVWICRSHKRQNAKWKKRPLPPAMLASINCRHQASLVILVQAGRSLEGISLSVHFFRNFGGQKIQVGRDFKIRRFLPH